MRGELPSIEQTTWYPDHVFALVTENQGTTEHAQYTEAWHNGGRVRFRVFRGQKNGIAAQAFGVLPTDKLSGWINSNSGNATLILSREKITGITSLETAAS
jgi:hypothetical protein